MKIPVVIGAAMISLMLGVLFTRALPDAVEREKVGQQNFLHSVCDEALHPEAGSPLGALPVDAPDFTLKDYADRAVTLSALRGRVTLVNFWATWCPPCVEEAPSLDDLARANKKKPFSLLAVSVDDTWPTVRGFFAKGTEMTVLLDPEKTAPRRYGTEKYPETFIVDKDGKVRFYVIGGREWNAPNVQACLDALMD